MKLIGMNLFNLSLFLGVAILLFRKDIILKLMFSYFVAKNLSVSLPWLNTIDLPLFRSWDVIISLDDADIESLILCKMNQTQTLLAVALPILLGLFLLKIQKQFDSFVFF